MKVLGVFRGLTFLFLVPLYIYLHIPRMEGRETDMMLSIKQRLRSLEQQAARKWFVTGTVKRIVRGMNDDRRT